MKYTMWVSLLFQKVEMGNTNTKAVRSGELTYVLLENKENNRSCEPQVGAIKLEACHGNTCQII